MEAPIPGKRALLVLLAVLLLGLLSPLPANAVTFLTNDTFDQENSVISGNRVVYIDWSQGWSELVVHNLDTGLTQAIAPNAQPNAFDGTFIRPAYLAVSGTNVAWEDFRLGYTHSRIYAYTLPGGPERQLHPQPPVPPGGITSQLYPAVWTDPSDNKPKMVWMGPSTLEGDQAFWDIYLSTDPVASPVNLTKTFTFWEHAPSIAGGVAVWFREDSISGIDPDHAIMLWDLSWNPATRSPVRAVQNWPMTDRRNIQPSIWRGSIGSETKTRLAWSEKHAGDANKNIYWVEYGSASPPASIADGLSLQADQRSARISGDYVVWEDQGRQRIVGYHIPSQTRQDLGSYSGIAPQPSLDDARVVWTEGRGGGADAEIALVDLRSPAMSSSTHPSQAAWSNQPTALFSWQPPLGFSAEGFCVELTSSPSPTNCNTVQYGPGPHTIDVTVPGAGSWYFQVRAKLASGWGPPGTYRVQIDATPPTVQAGNDVTLPAGVSWKLTGAASDAQSGIDQGTYKWTFTDGTSLNGAWVTKGFSSAGSYTATLTVLDKAGNTGSDSLTVTVTPTSNTDPGGGSTGGSGGSGGSSGGSPGGSPTNVWATGGKDAEDPKSPFEAVWMNPNPVFPTENLFMTLSSGKTVSMKYTYFCFTINRPGYVWINIYNYKGPVLRKPAKAFTRGGVLYKQWLAEGRHYVIWDGKDASGRLLAPGTYRYVLELTDGVLTDRHSGTVTVGDKAVAASLVSKLDHISALSAFERVWMYPNPIYPRQNRSLTLSNGKTVSMKYTYFCFTLKRAGYTQISIYDYRGLVRRFPVNPYVSGGKLYKRWLTPDRYYILWDGRDQGGRLLAPGTYRYVLEVNDGKAADTHSGTVTIR